MAKKGALSTVLAFLMWVVGVVVSLSVAFAMTAGTLTLPDWLGGSMVASIAGWIVVIITLIGVLMAIIEKLS